MNADLKGRAFNLSPARASLVRRQQEARHARNDMRGLTLALTMGLAAAPGLASAQGPAQDGLYLRAGAGAAFLKDWDQDYIYNPFLNSTQTLPRGQAVDFSAGFVAAAAVGFDYTEGIRTELEYRYSTSPVDSYGVETFSPTSGGFEMVPATPANDSVNAHLLMTNFFYDFNNASTLTPFIGLGVGGAFVENEAAMRDAALAYQGRAGVSVAFADDFTADLEYVFTRSNKLDFGPGVDDFSEDGPFDPAIAGARYQANSVMVSLRKKF